MRYAPFLLSVFCLAWVTATSLQAQDISVQASVNTTELGTDEVLTFTLSIQGSDGGNVQPPAAPESRGLALLQSTPGTQRSVSIVNGRVSQSFAYVWTFRPLSEGQARIEAVNVTVGDRTFHTEPIDLEVVPQAQRPQRQVRRNPFASPLDPPDNTLTPEPPSARDMFIRANPTSATLWQNEQLVIEYQLYFRDGIQLRQSRLTDSWEAEGFWREELDVETRPVPQSVVENGLRYNVITLKRAAVFPARAGNMRIDPLKIESEAMLPVGRRDPFQSLFSTRSQYSPVSLESPEITVTARPLPDGAPTLFQGAVGDFTITGRVDKRAVEVGNAVKLTVTIAGRGNLATMSPPPLDAPAVFDTYNPQSDLDLNRSGALLSGRRTFTYVLIPRANGEYVVPPVSFSFFDPDQNQYKTISTASVTISVSGTSSVPDVVSATTNGLPVNDVAPVFVSASDWSRTAGRPLHTRWSTYLLILLPILVWGAASGIHHHRRRMVADPSRIRGRRAHPLSRKHLEKASELLQAGDTAGFFEELDRAVLGFVGNRLDVSELGMTRQKLDDVLASKGVPAEVRARLASFLDTCDSGRYAPSRMDRDKQEQALDDAWDLIPELDAYLS